MTTRRPIIVVVDYMPDGSNDLVVDDVVIVAFRMAERSQTTTLTIFQPRPDRRVKLNAAKALLSELAEDPTDAYGKAAAHALERVHRKL